MDRPGGTVLKFRKRGRCRAGHSTSVRYLPMARRLFNVADLFTIRGRGIVLLPGIVPINDERFGPGDPLLLKRPDGTELKARIKWLEWRGKWVGEPPNPRPYSVLLEGLTAEDVPQGTEVWSVDG